MDCEYGNNRIYDEFWRDIMEVDGTMNEPIVIEVSQVIMRTMTQVALAFRQMGAVGTFATHDDIYRDAMAG